VGKKNLHDPLRSAEAIIALQAEGEEPPAEAKDAVTKP